MAREKIKTLFNKNYITISKVENSYSRPIKVNDEMVNSYAIVSTSSHGGIVKIKPVDRYTYKGQEIDYTDEEVRLKSPLGFYYTKVKRIYHNKESNSKIFDYSTKKHGNAYTLKTWVFRINTQRYEISYMIECNGVRCNVEVRPWDLGAGKSMWEDHLVDDLKNEIDKIFDEVNSKKIKVYSESSYYHSYNDRWKISDLHEAKRTIYTDLFGYPDGPKFQTNAQKILAHGFDLKTSFRNM